MIAVLVRRSVTEAVDDGALRAVAAWGALLVLAAPAASAAGIGAGGRVAADLAAAGTALLTGGTAIALGVRQTGVEIRARRAIAVLARPIPIGVWIGSRLAGIALVLAASTGLSALASALVLAALGASPGPLAALPAAWAHGVVLAAAAMAASSLARPALAALAACVVWPAAFLADDAAALAGAPWLAWFLPSFDGAGPASIAHALAWSVVYAAIATWGVGRSDRG